MASMREQLLTRLRGLLRGNGKGHSLPPAPVEEQQLTTEEVRALVDELARRALDTSADEANRRLEAGELDGTVLESELRLYGFLLGRDSEARATR
jgi:hypothetical protein